MQVWGLRSQTMRGRGFGFLYSGRMTKKGVDDGLGLRSQTMRGRVFGFWYSGRMTMFLLHLPFFSPAPLYNSLGGRLKAFWFMYAPRIPHPGGRLKRWRVKAGRLNLPKFLKRRKTEMDGLGRRKT